MKKRTMRIVLIMISIVMSIPIYILLQKEEGTVVSPWLFFIAMTCFLIAISCFIILLKSFTSIQEFSNTLEQRYHSLSNTSYRRRRHRYNGLLFLGMVIFVGYLCLMEWQYIKVLDGIVGQCIVTSAFIGITIGIVGSIRYGGKVKEYIVSFFKVCILGESLYYEVIEEEDEKNVKKL